MKQVSTKGFVIFSETIAGDLIHKGFKLLKVRPNDNNKEKQIFVFENTELFKIYVKANFNIIA